MVRINATIDDMKMPKCCFNCRFRQSKNLYQLTEDHYCIFDLEWMSKKEKFNPFEGRLDNCPLKEVTNDMVQEETERDS